MINYKDPIIIENIELLLQGYFNPDLPPIFSYKKYLNKIQDLFEGFINSTYNEKFNKDETPSYTYSNGIEPIVYYDFKKNNTLREMMLPCFKSYIIFVYKTINVYETLFKQIYTSELYKEYISCSNSNLLSNNKFNIYNDYNNIIGEYDGYLYQIYANKKNRDLRFMLNEKKVLDMIGTKQYIYKVDIESFYPNIYTHLLRNLQNNDIFSKLGCGNYFDFLDEYNMKINSDQTKGIVTGIYSSEISSELLMIAIDKEIKDLLNKDGQVGYIRYVDDMIFATNSKDDFSRIFPMIQEILNKYRLRVNPNKITEQSSISFKSYTDIFSIKREFTLLENTDKKLVISNSTFNHIKYTIEQLVMHKDISALKSYLSFIKSYAVKNNLLFENDDYILFLSKYLIILSTDEPLFSTRCYMILDVLIEKYKNTADNICDALYKKTEVVDLHFNNTMLQIWHYYILIKNKKLNFDSIKQKDFKDINPLIVTFLIEFGEDCDKIFNEIKSVFCKESHHKSSKYVFMKEIMCSRWWLPVMSIINKNNLKLNKYFENDNFDKFYLDLNCR